MNHLLVLTAEAEIQQEIDKQILFQHPLFEPSTVYQRLLHQGVFCIKAIDGFLRDNNIQCNRAQLSLLEEHFQGGGYNNYQRWLTIIRPRNQAIYAKAMIRRSYVINDMLPSEIEELLSNLLLNLVIWKQLLADHRKKALRTDYHKYINNLFRTPILRSLSIKSLTKEQNQILFKLIDVENKNYITPYQFYAKILKGITVESNLDTGIIMTARQRQITDY